MEKNRRTKIHNVLGSTEQLLQGILRCGRDGGAHIRRIMPNTGLAMAKRTGNRTWYYVCDGSFHDGGERCMFVPGRPLDQAVRKALLARLTLPAMEVLRVELRKALDAESAQRRNAGVQLGNARRLVAELKHRYGKVDPDNRRVAGELEKDLERAMGELVRQEAAYAEDQSETLAHADEILDELSSIAGDVPRLFDAPTTDAHDRKLLLRTMIESVVIDTFDRECVRARICWADGAENTIVESPVGAYHARPAKVLAAQGLTFSDIAKVLNERGLRTRSGLEWDYYRARSAVVGRRRAQIEDPARR